MAGPRISDRSSSLLSNSTAAVVGDALPERRTSHHRRRSSTHTGMMDLCVPEMYNIRKWDGADRACSPWDSLGRDPELWFRDGNCFVHLYAKGQSRRGPAFKVPLAPLLEAKCHPLVARFMARDGLAAKVSSATKREELYSVLDQLDPTSRIELYIPPPPIADRQESLRYHIATRNFFAWVFRRPLVGEHLGSAFINLLNSMTEFRRSGVDNMDGVLAYLDEEGYLDLRNYPIHALAALHFAEYFEFKSLYLDAFTHCVGMYDRLFAIPEYQVLTSVTRKLVRQAKTEMDLKLARAGQMLRNMLEDEFSEAHIGLSAGSRAHLDRFRTFLLSFYTSRFGYFPPQSVDTHCLIFERDVYCTMRKDFEALYEYLVDEGFTTSQQMPALAQGGICTLQSVHGFDLRNKYTSLEHPLPLLPEIAPVASSRRMSWLGKCDKLRPDQRLMTHAALLKASNMTRPSVSKNQLVIAYKKFEEESIFTPLKVDRSEKVSQIDARKLRWILIYSAYQVLRSCADAPVECQETTSVRYNISVNVSNLPPWKETKKTGPSSRKPTDTNQDWYLPWSLPTMPAASIPTFSSEIKPDIDYLALSHRDDSAIPNASPPPAPPRCQSLKNKSFRRSFGMFYPSQCSSTVEPALLSRNRTSFHEILVRGYGNGTNDVSLNSDKKDSRPASVASTADEKGSRASTPSKSQRSEKLSTQSLAIRSPSTSSTSSSNSTAKSSASGISDAPSASTVSTAPSPSPRHSVSTWTIASSLSSQDSRAKSEPKMTPPAVPRRNSRRRLLNALHPIPLRIRKGSEQPAVTQAGPPYDSIGWYGVDGSVSATVVEEDEDDLWMKNHKSGSGIRVDVWDQFANVGGLTEAVPASPIHEGAKA